MREKFKIFLILTAILKIKSEVQDQSLKCDFENWTLRKNKIVYGCTLNNENINIDTKPTRIEGQHLAGHSNDSVKLLTINKENQLKIFPLIFCKTFKNMEFLVLDSQVESFERNAFHDCKNLKILILNGNFSSLEDYLLFSTTELQEIEIKNSKLKSLSKDFFLSHKRLKILILRNNQLENIDPKWFRNSEILLYLDLSKNNLIDIPPRTFILLETLKMLSLNGNKIKYLHSKSFEGLSNLEKLLLKDNEISDLPENIFVPLKNLNHLDLSENRLTSIHSDSFGSHSNFLKIYFKNNAISAVDPKFFQNLPNVEIYMENNLCSYTANENGLEQCLINYRERIPKPVSPYVCGESASSYESISSKSKLAHGDYPWLAALKHKENNQYFCGGMLISQRKVLTVAHCIQDKGAEMPIAANDVYVVLGLFDSSANEENGRVLFDIQTIVINPNWNTVALQYDADIAVIVLAHEAPLTQFIWPICLIDPELPIAPSNDGLVVGYGKSEGGFSQEPKVLNMPLHDNEDCFLTFSVLARISSVRTFCAGNNTGISVCKEDSGFGLVVSSDNKFYLHGLATAATLRKSLNCNQNSYSIFTNVLKFYDWINRVEIDGVAE